jgi:hypothetical protein
MGLVDRLVRWLWPEPARELEDPDFGPICFEETWSSRRDAGATFRDGLRPVWVDVPGTKRGPSEAARRAYHELGRRYDELSPGIAALLFDQFDASFGAYPPDGVQLPAMAQPLDILKHAELTSVWLRLEPDTGEPTIVLAYGFAWDPGHCYDVTVRRWEATALDVHG